MAVATFARARVTLVPGVSLRLDPPVWLRRLALCLGVAWLAMWVVAFVARHGLLWSSWLSLGASGPSILFLAVNTRPWVLDAQGIRSPWTLRALPWTSVAQVLPGNRWNPGVALRLAGGQLRHTAVPAEYREAVVDLLRRYGGAQEGDDGTHHPVQP